MRGIIYKERNGNIGKDLKMEREVEVKELHVNNHGECIYGIAHIPADRKGPVPMVFLCHGLGVTSDNMIPYAQALAQNGIGAYRFDFRGGGNNSRSDGATTKMSPMTEVSDLEAVLKAAKSWEFVDWNHVFLMGNSQGGLVCALTAPRYQNEIQGEILLYPAFVVPDILNSMYASVEEVPESQWFEWLTLGKKYYVDMAKVDVYQQASRFQKSVLLLHGDLDELVPISYSKRLAEEMEQTEFHIISGAGHGFSGENLHKAVAYILDFLQKRIVIDTIS